MVEIALYDARDAVGVDKIEGQPVRVHVGKNHNSGHIAEALRNHGLDEYADEAVRLYSDDSIRRKFDHQGEYVLITAEEPAF